VKRYWVRIADEEFEVGVEAAGGVFLVSLGGSAYRVELTEVVPAAYTLVVDGACHDLTVLDRAGPWTLILDGARYRAEIARTKRVAPAAGPAAARSEEVRAPMPGIVVTIEVGEGSPVENGQAIAIMEAMKMQMEIRAPHAGTIKRIHVGPGEELAAGQLLVTME
jgi:acetyl/propionyl-CoA carboxylase alpha subunit